MIFKITAHTYQLIAILNGNLIFKLLYLKLMVFLEFIQLGFVTRSEFCQFSLQGKKNEAGKS